MIAQPGTPRNGTGPDSAPAERTKHAIEWAPERPDALKIRPDNIPLALQRRPQWVAWRYELAAGKDGLKRWTKVPTVARNWRGAEPSGNAKSTDPETWTTLLTALFYHYERGDSDGISFAFSADDPYCGVDLDDAIDPATGDLRDWARPIVADLDSYTEVSPSGTGVKIFLEGAVPGDRRKNGNVEMYDRARFFTVTGHHLPGTPEEVQHRPDALRRLYVQTFGKPRPAPSPKPVTPADPLPLSATPAGDGTSEDELIRLATAARNGAKFARLWSGDWSGYESQSSADLALCGILAYWCRRDTARMDALFRKSGLYREKKWNRRSYREPTLRKAVAGCARVRPADRDLPFTPEELAALAPLAAQLEPPDATPVARPARPASKSDKLLAAEEAATLAAQPQATVWAAAVARGPGVYLDQDPHAYPAHVVRGAVALAGVRWSLTVVRSGQEAEDTAATLRVGDGSGLRVAAYPKRGPANCANFEEVKQAENIGLSAGSVVCPTCVHNTLGECPFQKAMASAKDADHRVVTSARAAAGLADLARDAEAVFVLRDALDVLAPHAGVGGLRREHLMTLASAASRAATKARWKGRPVVWWANFRQVAEEVATRLVAGKPVAIPMPPVKKPPPLWGTTLWNLLRDPHGRPARIPRGLIRLLTAAVSGRLRSLDLQPSEGGVGLRLVGVWHPRLPPHAAVFAVELLTPAALVGVAVATDITTGAPPAWTARAVQVPQRRTAKQRPGSAAALLRGFLTAHPGERLCVLLPGRREQAEGLAVEVLALLAPDEAARVALVPWHGPAPGSPSALPPCDRIIGLGIPAVPPGSVRRRLIQCGDGDAARADGDWGERTWSRLGTDGTEVRVRERGYRHAAWHATYREVVQDLLRRRLVGATVPITLVTDLDLGLPLGDAPPALRAKDLLLLKALRDAVAAPASAATARGLLSLGSPSKSRRLRASRRVGVATAQLARAAGIAIRTAGGRLAVLEEAGLVAAVRTERGRLRGWVLPAVAGQPTSTPTP